MFSREDVLQMIVVIRRVVYEYISGEPHISHVMITSFSLASSSSLLSCYLWFYQIDFLRIHLDKVSAFASNETGELIFLS